MISLKSTKCLQASSDNADYVFEHVDDYFEVLPYLYSKIEGKWNIVVMAESIKEIRHIFEVPPADDVTVDILTDSANIEQYALERPSVQIENISPYEQYLNLFKDIDYVVFDPKAVSEIYHRAGPNIENLEKAVKEVISVSDQTKVVMADVDKVLLPNNRIYASDIMRIFLRMRNCNYRWSMVDRFISELGISYAYYSLRKYVSGLLTNKNKYLHNETVADRYKREVESIDALTIAHAYSLFMTYTKPPLLRVILYELERRNLTNVNLHT